MYFRYNNLLNKVKSTLGNIIDVIQGLAPSNQDIEEVMISLVQNKVPTVWNGTYPSLKNLGSWIPDLIERISFFKNWIDDKLPKVWWLPALTYPTGFLTAILQVTARNKGISVDSLTYESVVLKQQSNDIDNYPLDGVYISGLFLEGAGWNINDCELTESKPMELLVTMPVVHLKAVEKKKQNKGSYVCPIYMYPIRSGTRERPSYVSSIDLKFNNNSNNETWIKKGVALLLSTSN
jgi:dynein heavy chain